MEMLDGFKEFLGDLMNPDSLREAGIAAGAGAAGVILFGQIVRNVKTASGPVFDSPWKRAALAAGIGLVGGRLVFGHSPAMAYAVMGAMGGALAIEVGPEIHEDLAYPFPTVSLAGGSMYSSEPYTAFPGTSVEELSGTRVTEMSPGGSPVPSPAVFAGLMA